MTNADVKPKKDSNFLLQIIRDDLETKKIDAIKLRFPPEPNGYLHIGHAKSIVINFGLAKRFGGTCNLRFDDTNPVKEDIEYINSIKEDIKWLGFSWENECYTSDYFDTLYEYAVKLIKDGKAYVCDLDAETTRAYRGTLTEPGRPSPYRERRIEENLELFEKMKNGAFEDGAKTLRAKIDMKHGNINMRDPVIYRIKHAHHHRTGDKWCIYPGYDFAHGQSDSIEKITHSICTMEFEDHRPLYNWFIENLGIYPSKQYEFARLNINYTVMSKRKLLKLVQEQYVDGWDDPRMPTISGMRRRGYTPEAIRHFCDEIGVAKAVSTVDFSMLLSTVRNDLNQRADRFMAVIDPLKLTITNYPDDQTEQLEAVNNPEDSTSGTRTVPFSKVLYIEKSDFREQANKKFFRLKPGKEVRLQHGYYVTCNDYKKDENGNVTEIFCSYDPETRGGWSKDGRKVKGTLHWVSAKHAEKFTVRFYEHLFLTENPSKSSSGDFTENINPNSLTTKEILCEPAVKNVLPGTHIQFLRNGYFYSDPYDSKPQNPVFNKTCGLKDHFASLNFKH